MSQEEWSNPELVRSLKRIESDLKELRTDLKDQATSYVRVDDFRVWREGIGREFRDVKTEIAKVETNAKAGIEKLDAEANSKAVPWTAVGALALSALTAVVMLIQVIGPPAV